MGSKLPDGSSVRGVNTPVPADYHVGVGLGSRVRLRCLGFIYAGYEHTCFRRFFMLVLMKLALMSPAARLSLPRPVLPWLLMLLS